MSRLIVALMTAFVAVLAAGALRAQPAEHPACIPHRSQWAGVSGGTDVAAMDRVIATIPGICAALDREARRVRAGAAQRLASATAAPAPSVSTTTPATPRAPPLDVRKVRVFEKAYNFLKLPGQNIGWRRDNAFEVVNSNTGEVLSRHADVVPWVQPGIVRRATYGDRARLINLVLPSRRLEVRNTADFSKVAELKANSFGNPLVALSWNLRRVVTAEPQSGARVWNADTGELIATLPSSVSKHFHRVALSADGAHVVWTFAFEQAQVWNVATGGVTALSTCAGSNSSCDFSFALDGAVLLVWNAEKLEAWRVESGERLYSKRVRTVSPGGLVSRDGTKLVLFGGSRAAIVDAATGTTRFTVNHPGSQTQISAADFSPDGRYLVTGDYDGRGRIWDARTGAYRAQLQIGQHYLGVEDLLFSSDSRRIYAQQRDSPLQLWEIRGE